VFDGNFTLINTISSAHNSIIYRSKRLVNGFIATAAGIPYEIKIWNPTDNLWTLIQTLSGHSDLIMGIESINNNTLISVSEDGSLRVWDITNGNNTATITGMGTVRAVLKLKDGSIVTGFGDYSIRFWSYANGVVTSASPTHLIGHANIVNDIKELTNDRLASSSYDCNVIIWNLITKSIIRSINILYALRGLLILNSNLLAVNDPFGRTYVLNYETGDLVYTLTGHLTSCWFSVVLNNEFVFITSSDNIIKFWRLPTGDLLQTTTVSISDSFYSLVAMNDCKYIFCFKFRLFSNQRKSNIKLL
jgi:WD40 repeat protein